MELLEIEIAKSKVNDFRCELSESFYDTDTNSSINLLCESEDKTNFCPIICTYFDFIVFCIVFDWKEMRDSKQLNENKINLRR